MSVLNPLEPFRRPTKSGAWRHLNAGRLLGNALARFEARVLDLMVQAGHDQTRPPHIHLTRHLDIDGTRITLLAQRARMTNAAMTELIDQCEALGLVVRQPDPQDRRARVVQFTEAGRQWLSAFGRALRKAERELVQEIGEGPAATLFDALERYGGTVDSLGGQGSFR
ncbi:MAG: MarR family winged helix-turn-helix transcriptional regulator [Hydrogenophaga sp.]